MRNLDILVRNVRSFYEEALGHLVVTKLPDIISLTKDPDCESSVDDVQGLLLLILGCAVQSEKKEYFIDQIKQLDLSMQHAMVDCIQQVTDNPLTVWTPELSELPLMAEEQQEPMYNLLVQHFRRIVKERDDLWHTVNTLVVEKDGGEKCTTPRGSTHISILDKHHLGVELAEAKAKLRRSRQELEEKNEILNEVKEELEQNKSVVNKLRQESLDLLQDARAAKAYRDELDIVRERANKVDKLENEIQRYKDKLNELEFYKSRVEELREDNRILVETKEMLEDQLGNSRKRMDQILDLENDLLRHRARINELTLERDSDRDRMQELIEENAQMQMSAKRSMNESANLMVELDQLRSQTMCAGQVDSLSQQLNNDAQTRLRKIELENQRLQSIIDNMRESSFHENSEKILELDKENKRLSLKVNQLQDVNAREMQRCLDVEQRNEELVRNATNLQEMVDTVKMSSDRQQLELTRDKEQLLELVETLRQRNQKSQDARMKDIEAENKRLVENAQTMKSQISRLDFENQQLQKANSRFKELNECLSDIENQKQEVERENADLHQAIAAFKVASDKYEATEQEYTELQMKYNRVSKLLDNLKTTCNKIDRLEQDNINLTIENQRLGKLLEPFKLSTEKIMDMEQEIDDLNGLNQALRRNLEALKVDHARYEQMELDLIAQSTDNQKLQKIIENFSKKVQEVETENQSLESENQKLQKTIETLKVANRRLNDLERENTDLEAENHKLDRERKSSEKEVARLKQAIEMKDTTIDECSSKISTLDRENKRLMKELDSTTNLTARVKELEKENREIVQQSMIDKKTLITLREDLVNEKIKTQQLFNELEKLTSELQKIGLKKEKLIVAEHVQDEDRYKALETMMEDALKKSLNLKDEKIRVLEGRINDYIADLSNVQHQYEVLKQLHEEKLRETGSPAKAENVEQRSSKLTQEVAELRNKLSGVEKTNVTLVEENRNFRLSLTSSREQANSLQLQVTSLQHQATSMTEQNGVLQSMNAKLQVENTTLQSQNASLSTQITLIAAQNVSLEADREQLLSRQEELQNIHASLVTDHEALQNLHEQLSSEYESLLNELGSQKTSQKSLKIEYKSLKEKYQTVVTAQQEIEQLKAILEKERELFKADNKSLVNLRAEHSRLTEDFRLLHKTNEKLKMEYKSLQTEYKGLKTEHNTMKLKNTELQGELADARDHNSALDVELSKIHSKCEILSHINGTLEEDRRSHMAQVSTLLTQYHELLTLSLEDKEHFHEEEKSFADKLNNLRRQKEKLEEKIMEQYRRMDNYSPKKYRRGFGANLVRKVRRAGSELMNRVPRTTRNKDRDRSRRNTPESTDANDTLDNVSLGSGSVSNESPDSGSDATMKNSFKENNLQHSDSVGDLIHHSRQSSINRHLAFSTTALNSRKSTPSNSDVTNEREKVFRDSADFCIAGSFSSEDLISLRTDSRSSDGRQADIESITSSIVSGHGKQEDMNGSANVLGSKTLSLGTPGSRRAVYYADENDTIPTRDVGPIDFTRNKRLDAQENSVPNQSPVTPRSMRKNQTADQRLVRSSFSGLNNSATSSSPHRSSFRSSISCFGNTSPVHESISPLLSKKSPSSHAVDAPTIERKSPSSPAHRPIYTDPAITSSPSRIRQSWHQSDSSQPDDVIVIQNNSPTKRPNVLPVTPKLPNTPNQPLPDKSGLNNEPSSNITKDNNSKPPDNSIWYEYGCV
uniref:HOOK N-terminal domain-containing protein n=1 Tax=Strigamia maritima TaxID=126957 RepID=T1JB57_STRMM